MGWRGPNPPSKTPHVGSGGEIRSQHQLLCDHQSHSLFMARRCLRFFGFSSLGGQLFPVYLLRFNSPVPVRVRGGVTTPLSSQNRACATDAHGSSRNRFAQVA